MWHPNKLILGFFLLVSSIIYFNTFASRSQPYENPNYRRKQNEEKVRALYKKIEDLEQSQEEKLSDKNENEQLPLSTEERVHKALRCAAKGAAFGGLAGAGLWGAGALYVNHVGTTISAAACPGLGGVLVFSAIGGALYGYAISE